MKKVLIILGITLGVVILSVGGAFTVRQHLKKQKMQQFLRDLYSFAKDFSQITKDPNDYERCREQVTNLLNLFDEAVRNVPNYEDARKLVEDANQILEEDKEAVEEWGNALVGIQRQKAVLEELSKVLKRLDEWRDESAWFATRYKILGEQSTLAAHEIERKIALSTLRLNWYDRAVWYSYYKEAREKYLNEP